MSGFNNEIKIDFKRRLKKLNQNFSNQEFFALYNDLKPYLANSLIQVFSFLENFLQDDNIIIVNGLLALIYHNYNFMESARKYAIEARKHFPNTEIWDQIINNTIWDEFMQEYEKNEQSNN